MRERVSGVTVSVRAVLRVVVAGGFAVGLLAGCSADAAEPPGLTAPPTPTPSPTPTLSAGAEDEAAILDVYDRYWAAVVQVENGTVDPALFDGNATGAAVEEVLARARQFQEWGVARVGEPRIFDVEVERATSGTTATVWACVDNTGWTIPGVESTEDQVGAGGRTVEKVDGAWLVTGETAAPATMTC